MRMTASSSAPWWVVVRTQSLVCFAASPEFQRVGDLRGPRPELLHGAAVTRYLVKHFLKQLSALRNQKHELEDKIHDLEQVAEYERRDEV